MGMNISMVQASQRKWPLTSTLSGWRSAIEIQESLRIMRALADGMDPETGVVLTSDAVCQHPSTVRALHQAVIALEFVQERERNKRPLPAKAGKSWTRAEDQQVCEELRRGIDFQQIARTHNRSVGAIVARLVKLGKIGPGKPVDMFDPRVA